MRKKQLGIQGRRRAMPMACVRGAQIADAALEERAETVFFGHELAVIQRVVGQTANIL